MGLRIERFHLESVRELDAATAHWVHFVKVEALAPPVWNSLRVRLASASRRFIAYGDSDQSSAVVRALRDGAFDFVFAGEPDARWRAAVENAVEAQELWLNLDLARGLAAPEAAPATGGMLNRRQKWERARQLLEQSGNDRTWTAAQLGIHPATLFRWEKAGKI